MSRSSKSSSQSSRTSSNGISSDDIGNHAQNDSLKSSDFGSISPLKRKRNRSSRSSKSSIDSAKNKRIIANFNNNPDDTLEAGDYHEYNEIYINKCITCQKLYNQYNNENAQINDNHVYKPLSNNSRSSNRQKNKKRKKASRSSSRSGGTKRTKRRRNSKRKSKRRNT